jgi:hypothetical protein
MTNRAAYRLIGFLIAIGIPIELVFEFGPAADEQFTSFWEIWHPYYLFLFGSVSAPILFLYALPLARRLGGRATAYGRLVWYLTASMTSFIFIGPYMMFAEVTCPKWGSCDHPLGWVTNPEWGDPGYLLAFPLAVIAVVALMHGLGGSVRAELRRRWFVPALVAAIAVVAFVPAAGLDLAFHASQSGLANTVEAAYIVSSAALLTVTILTALRAQAMSGGMFTWPIRMMLLGTFIMAVGIALRVSTLADGHIYDINDPTVAPYTAGLILWMVSFLKIGGAIERLLGLDARRAPAAVAAAD